MTELDRVLSRQEISAMLGISMRTFARLEYSGEMPPRIRLSTRRVGYRLSEIRAWVDARELRASQPRREALGKQGFGIS